MPKALYIGSSTVDINASCPALKVATTTHQKHTEKYAFLSFASKTRLEDIEVTTGGSAANSAYTSSLLGTSVQLVSAVGNDLFGRIVIGDLKAHGIPTKDVRVLKNSKTGVGINILAGDGEKTNLVFKGATDFLGASELKEDDVKRSDVVACTSLASKKNFALFRKAVELSKRHGKPFVFAPSITMLRQRKEELEKMHGHFDVVVMNHEEAGFYTNCRDPLAALHKLPGSLNIVTNDSKGTYVEEGGKVWHVPTLKVDVVDTTGAGDSFTGALVHGLLEHDDVLEAVQLATATACLNIMETGAKVNCPKSQITSFAQKHRAKMKPARIR